MFTMPLKQMKLRTKELESAYSASFGMVRHSNAAAKHYDKFHQGWDLEAATGTPCYAIADGLITVVGYHAKFGTFIVLQFSRTGQAQVCAVDTLWSFYAHLSHYVVKPRQIVRAGQTIGFTGHSGNASASAPHLHFEIRTVPMASPGLGEVGRIDPAKILGYRYLVCS